MSDEPGRGKNVYQGGELADHGVFGHRWTDWLTKLHDTNVGQIETDRTTFTEITVGSCGSGYGPKRPESSQEEDNVT